MKTHFASAVISSLAILISLAAMAFSIYVAEMRAATDALVETNQKRRIEQRESWNRRNGDMIR
jgi:hypothetical protein